MARSESRPIGRTRAGVLVVAALAVLTMSAACASSVAPTIPTLRSAGASPGVTVSPEQAMRAYVSCMRDRGIAMPDPKVQPGNAPELVYPDVVDKRSFMTADESCRGLLVNAYPPTTPNPNGVQEQDQLLAYARCMREHGIAMDDPVNGGISMSVSALAGPEEAEPSFQAADRACAHFLPGKPGSSPTSSEPPASAPSASGSRP
jgi:hypothetical protein